MAQIKVVVLDDNGLEINTHFYALSPSLTQLNDMEREIEVLRPAILGDVTHDLLEQAQSSAELCAKLSHKIPNHLLRCLFTNFCLQFLFSGGFNTRN